MKKFLLLLMLIPTLSFGQVESLMSRPIQRGFNYSLSYGNRGGGNFYSIGYAMSLKNGVSSIEIGNKRLSAGLYIINQTPFTMNQSTDDITVMVNYIYRDKRIDRFVPSVGVGANILTYDIAYKIGVDYKISYPVFISLHYIDSRVRGFFIGAKIYLY